MSTLTLPQASLLADLMSAAGRKAPVLWLTGTTITYGKIMAITGPADDRDVQLCHAMIAISGRAPITLQDGQPEIGVIARGAGESQLRVDGVLEMMSTGQFVIDITPDSDPAPVAGTVSDDLLTRLLVSARGHIDPDEVNAEYVQGQAELILDYYGIPGSCDSAYFLVAAIIAHQWSVADGVPRLQAIREEYHPQQ
jgi:hypothetical protein